MKRLLKILIISIFLAFFSCSNEYKSLVQKVKTKNFELKLYKIESGAFGETAEIEIYDIDGNLIEQIGLRGEDYFPKVDSIVNRNIFISYTYPTQNEILNLEQVVLGDALLNKTKLKFNYNFKNIN